VAAHRGHAAKNQEVFMPHSKIRTIQPIMGAIGSVPIPAKISIGPVSQPVYPFLTISREPGAGAIGVGHQLADALNAELVGDEKKWTCWDREIVEKIAADHNLSERLVEGVVEKDHSWISSFLSSLSFTDTQHADEDMVYSRAKQTIGALASAGRVVIIGRGGVFITHRLPGGIHIRLVAPFEKRVAHMVKTFGLSEKTAAARIREIEKNRRVFFKMHWPNRSLAPDQFALTINTAEVESPAIVQGVKALVEQKALQLAR
jgi:cytidylate kinase